MGIKSFFKRQLRTVIEWKVQDASVLYHRINTPTDEIKNASKLIVSPSQGCLVVYDGKVMAVLSEPGTYEMQTDNHPFITTLLNLVQNLESEHKMRFYFYRSAEMVNIAWGTASPVKYMEPVYKLPVTLGAYGNFSVRVGDAAVMFANLIGNITDYSADNVREVVTSRVIPQLSSFLAQKAYPYQEVDQHLADMSAERKEKTTEELEKLGLTLTDFRIEAVTFDDDTMERIGKIAEMTTEARAAEEVGLDYERVQKLGALRDAAKNEGGLAGAGLQLGAGVQLAKDIFKQEGATTAKDAPAAQPNNDPTNRLRELKTLLDENLITTDEYNEKKQELLKTL